MDHLCHLNLCHVSPKLPQKQQEEQHTTLAIEEKSIGILVMLFILSWTALAVDCDNISCG